MGTLNAVSPYIVLKESERIDYILDTHMRECTWLAF